MKQLLKILAIACAIAASYSCETDDPISDGPQQEIPENNEPENEEPGNQEPEDKEPGENEPGENEPGNEEPETPEPPKEVNIQNLSVPEYVAVGETLEVKGEGFAADAVYVLGKDEETVEVTAEIVEGGVSIAIPSDMARGHYSLTITQEGASKVLSEDVWVTIRKKFKSATLNMSGIHGIFSYGWTVTRTDGAITELNYKNSWAEDIDSKSDDYIDTYVADGLTFTNTKNGTEFAYNKSVTFTETDGLITSAEAINEYEDPMSYVWNYDESGYIKSITHNDEVKYEVTYDTDMNVTGFNIEGWIDNVAARYDGAEQHNNPYAPSAVFAIFSVYQYTHMHHHFAYFNGMIKANTLLPTSIDWQGFGGFFDVTYSFDDDGYVSRISWKDSTYSDYSRIAIKYE